MTANEKLRQTQTMSDHFQTQPRLGGALTGTGAGSSILSNELELTALRSLLDTKQARILQLEQRMSAYENEITHLRELRGLTASPRDYAEKMVTDREYQEIKMKVDKMELEVGQKRTELQTNQARLTAAEDQTNELRKRIDLMKDSMTTKDQQISLMQADVRILFL